MEKGKIPYLCLMKRQVNSRYVTHLRTPDGARYSMRRTPLNRPFLEKLLDRIELKIQARRLMKTGEPDKLFEAGQMFDALKKYRKSFECYQQAAQQGHLKAQYELVLCYDFPKGCEQDLGKAFEMCLELAKKGLPEAMCRVGMYFEHGIGTYKDTESALHWYNEAAQQGNKLAQRNLKKLQSLISS